MPLRSEQIANLVGYLCNQAVYHRLVGSHSLKLKSQLVDRITKRFISLGLGLNKALNETFQVRFWLWWLRRWIVRGSVLKSRWLHETLGLRIEVL